MTRFLTIIAAAALLAACGEGTVVINLTDAPVDNVSAVSLRVTGVELEDADGGVERLDFSDREINVLGLTAGASTQLVSRDDIAAGDYRGVRLLIDADGSAGGSTVTLNSGGTRPLQLSGGDLLAARNFSVDDEDTTTLTIDVDLRRSLRAPTTAGGNYLLTPTLRLVQDNRTGQISGSVADALATAEGCDAESGDAGIGNVVYVFTGAVNPDDIDNFVPEPISSARAIMNVDTGQFDYTAAFLPAGDYTVAFTCQGEFDGLNTDDALEFRVAEPVTVAAGQTATIDFLVPSQSP